MKALLRNLLPGSAHNRNVDDMIDSNKTNKDEVPKKSSRTKSLFSSSASQLPTTTTTNDPQHKLSSNTTGCLLERPYDSGLESSGDDDEYYTSSHPSNLQYPPPQHGLNSLSSSFSNNGHQYFATSVSKESSSSSVLSSTSNGDSSLVVQTRSSPNVMQHSRQQLLSSNNKTMNGSNNNNNNSQSSSSSPATNTTTPNNKRRSSLSNAFRRLSLKKSSSSTNNTQQHADLSGVIGSPVMFADLLMSHSSHNNSTSSSSTSSIPIINGSTNNPPISYSNNYGGSFSSSNSILSSTTSTTTTTINNNHNGGSVVGDGYTPNSPPNSPLSPFSFPTLLHNSSSSAPPTNNIQQQQHSLSSFTATTPCKTPNNVSSRAGTEQKTTPTTPSSNNNSRRKSLNVITAGLSSNNNNNSSATTTPQQSNNGSGQSSNFYSPIGYIEPHSPSMMLMMASQASPSVGNYSNSSSHHHQHYHSLGSTPTTNGYHGSSSSLSTMGQVQRITGTQQLLDVFVNRRKWKELLCVNSGTNLTHNSNTSSSGNINAINESQKSKSLDSTARLSSPLSPEMSIISTTSTEDETTEQSSSISTYSLQLPSIPTQHVEFEKDGDEFKVPNNSPNENIFKNVILGGFLPYKDVLKCDLVCRAWHLRISHSKENFIYFLPQLLSSISVWEEKDDLRIMLATQIARNLSHLEISKRMLTVLFGLYRRSLHKEKIFNRAVFKEVLRSEVPDLLGLTDKANMFYKLTSPTWFSPYKYFQCPIYLYLAKRSLRFVEKIDGEFQQRVQILLKIKYHYEDTPSLPQSFLSVGAVSGVNSVCASPTLSPVISSRKLSLATGSPLVRPFDPRAFNDCSPDRPDPTLSTLNPPPSPLLNGNFSTSTSPSTKQLAQHQNTLADMISELKTCWFFAYGTIDEEQSDMQDRVCPNQSSDSQHLHQNVVSTDTRHHHEKPKLVHEKIIKFYSQFSLARMKNEVVFPEDEDSTSPFSASKASEITNKITSNIEHCYYEMTYFRNNPKGHYPSIKLADPEICEQFNSTMSRWVCELQKLGLYRIEFILQYVFKLLFYICTGPMYDRSEFSFGVASLHEMEENDQLETICTDPESSREKLEQWIKDYRNKHSECHIYHYYLKVKYECSGFTGGCNEESYLLTLRVSPDFSSFEFVSYLFESRYFKGMAISSLPLFIKKM